MLVAGTVSVGEEGFPRFHQLLQSSGKMLLIQRHVAGQRYLTITDHLLLFNNSTCSFCCIIHTFNTLVAYRVSSKNTLLLWKLIYQPLIDTRRTELSDDVN